MNQLAIPGVRSDSPTHLHPPKVELFDVPAMTNTDPKGFVREVEVYRVSEHGVYLARRMPGHPTFASTRTMLLPAHGVRVTRWGYLREADRDSDFYLDIVDICELRSGELWRAVDLYLDITVCTGTGQRLLDADELAAALAAGLIDQAGAVRAIEQAGRALDGIAAAGYDVDAWLAGQGISVPWHEDITNRS